MRANDSDVIKAYVAAGLGVGIVPEITLSGRDPLVARDITHRKRAEAERLRADAAELARSEVERIAVELAPTRRYNKALKLL